jgi:protein-tyrosine kinase
MSIVERAIKKLQQAQEASAVPPPVPRPATATAAADYDLDRESSQRSGAGWVSPRQTVRIDIQSLRRQRLLPPPEQERELAAQYRHIKRPLIAKGTGRGISRVPRGNAIMLTSALPGEGKSFTAINLALSMALEQELRVLLVDADVARPRLSRELGIDKHPGFIDALRDGSTDIESLVVDTDIPTLSVLSSGSRSDTATELMAGPRMTEIVRLLCERDPDRVVLFDSPPILPTTEARILAQAVGQVVVMVRASRTPQEALFEALHLIGQRDEVSLMLTHAERSGAGAYYYGNYTYSDYGMAENMPGSNVAEGR